MSGYFERIARYYDADYLSINYTADIPFYADMAVQSGGPVLEMGCGTGRVLLPIARAGIPIHGVDPSGAMLDVLRSKLATEPPEIRQRVSITQGDARSIDLGQHFALVTAPFRVAQIFADRDSQRAWLRSVRRHLAPGGVLVFDVFQPNYSYLVGGREAVVSVDRVEPETGLHIRRIDSVKPHNAFQTMDVELHWVVEDASGAQVSETRESFLMRWYTKGELENLLELEGFRILDYWGSFAREPFSETASDQVIRAALIS